jgi:hypothetical protein
MRAASIWTVILTVLFGGLVHGDVIAHYKFEETSGQGWNSTVNPNASTWLTRGPSGSTARDPQSVASGYSGNGLLFSGAQQAVYQESANSALLLGTTFTVEGHIKPTDLPADGEYQVLVYLGEPEGAKNYNIGLAGTASGAYLQCSYTDESGMETVTEKFMGSAVSADIWSYFGVSFDAATTNLYLQLNNDVEGYSAPFLPAVSGTAIDAPKFMVGERLESGFQDGYVGYFDELTISDTVTVPEPKTISLFAISSVGILTLRRALL